MRLAPAHALDQVLDDRWPDRAREIVSAREDGHRHAPTAGEPERGVGEKRPERHGAGDAHEQGLGEGELPEVLGRARRDVADAEGDRPARDRQDDPEAIGESAHQDPAHADADHRHRVGQRRIGARDTELRLHGGQGDDDRPHADPADGREQERRKEARPGIGGLRVLSRRARLRQPPGAR